VENIDFVAQNSNKLQKLGLERKIRWAFNVFTLDSTIQATLVPMTHYFDLLDWCLVLLASFFPLEPKWLFMFDMFIVINEYQIPFPFLPSL
jgi:hypothetical protein